jgi:catechol 2,3-dioxygenase-like lactoylglutathione lyase family enzyme
MITGVDFTIVPTQDIETAKQFYGEVLGLEATKQWGSMPAFEFETGNLTLAVVELSAFGQEFRPNGGAIALQVADVAAARAELESRGVTFHTDIIDSGVCHQAYFNDPDGNPVGIHHRYAPKT